MFFFVYPTTHIKELTEVNSKEGGGECFALQTNSQSVECHYFDTWIAAAKEYVFGRE